MAPHFLSGRTFRLLCTLTLTCCFFFVELIVGNITKSMALVADSFHMLSDVLSLLVGLFAIKIAKKTLSSKNTFGWVRAEVLGALVNGVFLIALCFSIVVESIARFFSPEKIEDPRLVIYVGAAGLGINIIGLLLFHEHGHGHSHGHGHGHGNDHSQNASSENLPTELSSIPMTNVVTNQTESDGIEEHGHSHGGKKDSKAAGHGHSHSSSSNLNMRAVFLHILGDALGSVAVIIGACIVEFTDFSGNYYIDPALSLFIAALLLSHSIPVVKQSSMVLLQSVPSTIDVEAIKVQLCTVPGVVDVHELHVWELAGDKLIATVHIASDSKDTVATVSLIKGFFHNFGIHSTTVQLEPVADLMDLASIQDEKACLLDCSTGNERNDCGEKTCCAPEKAVVTRKRTNKSMIGSDV